jgi:hypothetical protein
MGRKEKWEGIKAAQRQIGVGEFKREAYCFSLLGRRLD